MLASSRHRAYIALGSNLAQPIQQIRTALSTLARLPGTTLERQSSLYRSAPVECDTGPEFINAVAEVQTELSAPDLLQSLLNIERDQGRLRSVRNAPRTLDLDLLLYDDLTFHESGLTLPHPRLHQRAFVLLPLLEIAPDCVLPGKGPAADWLAAVQAQSIARLD